MSVNSSNNSSNHSNLPNLNQNLDNDDPFARSDDLGENISPSAVENFSEETPVKQLEMENTPLDAKENFNANLPLHHEKTFLKQNPPDSVFISGLKVDAIIGVYEWEQAITQPLIFDIDMHTSQQTAAHSDHINDAINYKTVCERVAQISKTSKVALLERLAQLVADMILQEFNADSVVVTIHKPTAIKQAASVGVKIHRARVI